MTSLNVETIGQGSIDLALIHGWGIGKVCWRAVLPTLATKFRLHLVELPGYGSAASRMDKQPPEAQAHNAHEQTASAHMPCRPPSDAPLSVSSSFNQTAEALVEALPKGCILCGWSLGSLLAMQAQLLAPQHFSRLILVGSTPRFTQTVRWSQAQAPGLLKQFSNALSSDANAVLQRFVALLNQGDAKARTSTRQLTEALSAAPLPDTAALIQGLAWLRGIDLRPHVAAIDIPTLLIHGEHDPLMPLAAAHWLAERLPKAQLDVFAGAAHAPFISAPERFAELIVDYCHAPAAY